MAKHVLNIDLNGLEILVVEDDAVSSLLISHALSRHGACVETAANGRDGLLKYEMHRFPVIVTDINMPIMNGIDLASRIKALDPDARIIATSANRETECLVSAIALGFSDYILKPVEIEKLLLAVKRCADVITVKQQLENEREKFRTLVESLGEGIVVKDLDYRILYQNSAMIKMFGERRGSACYSTFGQSGPCQDCPAIKTLEDGQTHSACMDYKLDGAALHVEITSSPLRDISGAINGTVDIVRDISERIKNEQTIRDMAFHDPLTGLSNRRLFEDRLEQAIAKSRRYGMKFGLISLDLDHFKNINDTFGHECGDQVLIEAADRIRSCCKRDLDTISRHGGDEFCIIFTDCVGKEQLTAVAETLLTAFARPFQLPAALANVTTSIGISIFPEDGMIMKDLEIASDRAMYAAKRAGRNTFRFIEAIEPRTAA
jgi:diguanylate cyclase (GGDEF)-like protein